MTNGKSEDSIDRESTKRGTKGSLLNRILGSHETEASESSNFDMASWMCSCRSPVAATTYSSIEPTA